ncbi:hypothetical protein U2P60_02810 [Brucella sp. H1_1004]|uniref:hypothetical protein n=1 Tax=Brucella sp. H1_1004 TaxID=3110109 RepID=UPI0039B60D07
MLGPKEIGPYPDREIDCQEAVSEGVAELLEQATLEGRSPKEAEAVIDGTSIPGASNLIEEAVEAGWSADEAADAITIVSEEIRKGEIGVNPTE